MLDLKTIKLPPALQKMVDEFAPIAKERYDLTREQLAPLFKTAVSTGHKFWEELAKAGTGATVGSTFRHLCIVGLNRSELLLQNESQSVFADNWQDLADESLRRHMAVIFFAPRGLDGQPVNPYLFLAGENTEKTEEEEGGNTLALAQQTIGSASLLDFCRLSPAEPNTVNILIAADTLFHWDIKDNYVLPTTPTNWTRDVEQVIKSYPRTTRAVLYTQWETDLLHTSDKLKVYRLRDLPLDPNTWLNQPTVQEKYGSYLLLVALALAGAVFAGLWFKQKAVAAAEEELQVVEQQIPRGGQFSDLEKAIAEQEKMFTTRDTFALAVKDTTRAIQLAEMEVDNIEVRVPEPNEPPKQYLVTIEAAKGAYQGWLQEEPIARAVLLNSALMEGIRKPPTATGFKLEGLIDATKLQRQYRLLVPQAELQAPASTTMPRIRPSTTVKPEEIIDESEVVE